MATKLRKSEPSFVEFIVLISLMMSLTALSIDAMLPALPAIGSDLGVQNENDRQLVVSTIFIGIAFGQLIFGPLSDKSGRRPALFVGFFIYIAGALFSTLATSFPMMLIGRVLQGLGISAPRAITLALVRDLYKGRKMAQVMSFSMTIFILVPMLAPALGQTILLFSTWRSIFVSFIVIAALTITWFGIRMPETLAIENRKAYSLQSIALSTLEILRNRISIGYTVSAGLISGLFLGYLNSSQQIFQEQYALGKLFPLIFATISLSLGFASYINARLVMRYGMRFLVQRSLLMVFGLGVISLGITMSFAGHPPLWMLILYIMLTFFCVGILFGNQNTLAMEPLGQLAGLGSAIVGSLSTLISTPLGILIGQAYNGTVTPLVLGIVVLTGLTILVGRWAES